MENKAKEKKTRKPWGEGRLPLLHHLASVCRALGHEKFDREKVWAVLLEQVQRDPTTFAKEHRKFHKQYVKVLSMKAAGQKAVLTQMETVWGVKPLVRKRRASIVLPQSLPPLPAPQKPSLPPPPPPNAVSARPAVAPPPPPPNAVEVKAPPLIGDELADTWNDVFEGVLPPIPEGMGQSVGTLYGADKGKKAEAPAHERRVCISIKFKAPEDQAKVIKAVQGGLDAMEPFGACLMNSKHSRRPDGFWVDLLIHYSVEVVDLYKSVLSCDLVLDAEASPADAFGKTAQNVESLD